jgi:predicted NBD/HSP70 family sugar kinase
MTELVGSLMNAGLVEEEEGRTSIGRGRPGRLIRLRAQAVHFVGAEIGVERLVAVALDLGGAVVGRAERPGSLVGVPVATVLRRLALLVAALRTRHPALGPAGGLGVAVPGFMTRDGVVLAGPLLGWRGVDMIAALREQFDCPVMAENDANATAHGEWHFVPEHRGGDLLAVVLAQGVGCGLMADGRILRGAHGLAGGLGHMVVDPAGDAGMAWEALVGRSVARKDQPDMPADWPTWLAHGLAAATYAYDPETIVIAGELTGQFQRRQQEVAVELRRLLVSGFPMPKLTAARFGADGCAIGAASLLHARFIDRAEA